MAEFLTVPQAVARALAKHVHHTFGVMGNGNARFIEELGAQNVPYTAVRHEMAAAAAADSYFRGTRKLALATTSYGPAFTNLLTGLAEATLAHTPLVCVVGDAPVWGQRPHDVDQVALAQALNIPYYTVSANSAVEETVQAVETAFNKNTPVIIAIPYNLTDQMAVLRSQTPEPNIWPQPALARDEMLAQTLNDARHPLIVAGRGALTARSEVLELAGRLRCDVATTAPAQGFFPYEGPWRHVGIVGGFAPADGAINAAMADVVLVLGAGLNKYTTAFGDAFHPEAVVIQIDLVPDKTHERVDMFYQADVREAVRQILPDVEQRDREIPPPLGYPDPPRMCMDARWDPRGLIAELDTILPAEKMMVTDGGNFIGWPNMYFSFHEPDSVILTGTSSEAIGMGWASAIGVSLAAQEKDRFMVAVLGDGGALMGLADAESFLRVTKRGVVIIMNDEAYGSEYQQYKGPNYPEESIFIAGVDFAAIFRAFGGNAITVRNESDLDEFKKWVDSGKDGVYLLDCHISRSIAGPFIGKAFSTKE